MDLGYPEAEPWQLQVNDLLEGPAGNLWIATRYLGLLRRMPDGTVQRYFTPIRPPSGNIRAIAPDGEGGIWAGGWDGVRRLVSTPGGGRLAEAETFTSDDGLPSTQVYALHAATDGAIVAGTAFGLGILSPDGEGRMHVTGFGARQGLEFNKAIAIGEDSSGNIWIGSDGAGVWKLIRNGLTTFTTQDSLPGPYPASFVRDRGGGLYVSTHDNDGQTILNRLGPSPGKAIRVNVPAAITGRGWGVSELTLQDRSGDWWVPTAHGLVRFSGAATAEDLATAVPSAIYTTKDGLPNDEILRLFEDSRGDIWIAAYGLVRYDHATGRFEDFGADGPGSIAEDADGDVWLGFWGQRSLKRYRNGRFDVLTVADGVPRGDIECLFRDSRGRIWIGSSEGGAGRIDEPAADKPRIVAYTEAGGLSSSEVRGIAEDRFGRIYLGTGRGVDVIEPDSGRIRHFGTADGLASNDVMLAAGDASGDIWFGTQSGVSRLTPAPPQPQAPPTVMISELAIAGIRHPISLLGETSIENLTLTPDQSQIDIAFVGLEYEAGEQLRYQYRLLGANEAWSAPSTRRSVSFAHLSPGVYRFSVRAVDSDGQSSLLPATVSFEILRPVWQRAWFLGLAALSLGAGATMVYRARVAHLLALERVRTHIATDLHDDIGASLSQIAILNEVALARLGSGGAGDASGLLATAAQSARELVDTMSDLVWAVDPKRDRMEDLVLRMRRFSEGLCAARAIDLSFTAAGDEARRLPAQVRRQAFLLFKESLNNAVKHSGCRSITATLALEARLLRLEIADDGTGFDPDSATEGNGLASMRQRCRALGGVMELLTAPGQGTRLRFVLPA